MKEKVQRNGLTASREEFWRYLAGGGGGDFTEEHCELAAQALQVIDALTAALAAMFQQRKNTDDSLSVLNTRVAALVEELLVARAQAQETVICSAIRLPDGKIFRGHRHGDCIRTARDFVNWNGGVLPYKQDLVTGGSFCNPAEYWNSSMCADQGFITSRNRYVCRKEAMQLQLAAGIESVSLDGKGYRGATLFSEDCY